MKTQFRYIYGPVSSWRVGSSLGIDPISQDEKICSYDCPYCQLGATKSYSTTRQLYVPEDSIVKEVEMLPSDIAIDYLTISGRGEPTLAFNLRDIIKALKNIRHEPVAVITNSSLINRQDVRDDLSCADFVIAKLDASSQESFLAANRPFQGALFNDIVEGIRAFRKSFKGKLAIQIMFIEQNLSCAKDISDIVQVIQPGEVQINTPLRPCGVRPLSREQLHDIQGYFDGIPAVSVYESHKKTVRPVSEKDTLKRRGKDLDGH